MKIKLLYLTLLFTSFISCKSETTTEKQQPQLNLDFVQTYEGTIANKYPLHIKLKSDAGVITGNYFYDKVGTDIKFNGTITNDSVFTLNEFDINGNQVGLWKGKLVNENKISGDWSKPDGSSATDFKLIATSSNYETVKREFSNSKYAAYSGTYNSPYNEGGISFGILEIEYTGNKEIRFEIKVGHIEGCTGHLKGTAKIKSNGQAIYSGPQCESLIFNFQNREVKVKEKKCEHHGMRCYFDGTFKK
jgi:hypothetical protein